MLKILALASLCALAAPCAIAAENDTTPQAGYATVNADGSLARSSNVQNVLHTPGSGAYTVQFINSVSKCAPSATIQGDPGLLLPGYITVARPNNKSIIVTTFATLSVLPSDFKFSLGMICAQ